MNPTLESIQPSATLAISAKAKELAAQGVHVCSFAAGEPDFDTPALIKDAACRAIADGQTKYTPAKGLPALCRAIAEKLRVRNGLDYDPATEIIVSAGGKQSLAYAFEALLSKGDEVLIPSPYWLSYPEMVKIAGGKPKFVKTKRANGYKLTPAQLEKAIRPRTKVLVLNYPSNPTGAVYSADELRAIGEVAVAKGLWIVADEMYERMVYTTAPFVSIASLSPAIKARTVTVNGCSKAYSMTGWRIGYAAAPKDVVKLMTTCQSHCASNPCTPAQFAALEAFTNPAVEEQVKPMLDAFRQRADRIYRLLRKIPGIRVARPEGAFYVFPCIKAFGLDSVTFCRRLLEEKHVAAVPGEPFGAPDCIRFSYACSMDNIEEGMRRFAEFCEGLRK